MARSDKLYSKSPRLERKENGDMGVMKPTAATDVDTGIAEPVHTEQLADMYDRHTSEHRSMTRRHLKEVKSHFERMAGGELPEPADKIEKE